MLLAIPETQYARVVVLVVVVAVPTRDSAPSLRVPVCEPGSIFEHFLFHF